MKELFFFALAFVCTNVFAQTDTLFKSSVQDIMNLPVQKNNIEIELASKKGQKLEEAPSVVSVITQDDIQKIGARDLADVLRSVAGFEFGNDALSMVGLGFRGVWLHEGKQLMMLNGILMNDIGNGLGNFIGTFPLQMVEKIEIIRGAGSALYGTFAEFAVINIITHKPKQDRNILLNTNTGFVGNQATFGTNLSVTAQHRQTNIALHLGYNFRPLSAENYTDFKGNLLKMNNENSPRNYAYLHAQIQYKNLEFGYNHTNTNFYGQDGFDFIVPMPKQEITEKYNHFRRSLYAKYAKKIGQNFSIHPRIEYHQGNNIPTGLLPNSLVGYNSLVSGLFLERGLFELQTNLNLKKYGESVVGFGASTERATIQNSDGTNGLYNSYAPSDTNYVQRRSTQSFFIYVQHQIDFGALKLTVGNRFENTSFGQANAPRIGLNLHLDRWHFKLLFGKAFRIPMPFQAYSRFYALNINGLKPEYSQSSEVEIGYQINDKIKTSINFYHNYLQDPITWLSSKNAYYNYESLESMGAEGEIKADWDSWGATFNFSYTQAIANGTSAAYLTDDKKYFLAMPPFKANLTLFFKYKLFTLTPYFTFLSTRYGQTADFALGNTNGNYQTQAYDALLLSNFNLVYSFKNKMTLNFACYNIFKANYQFIQPYYGGHAPIPAQDRQVVLGFRYEL